MSIMFIAGPAIQNILFALIIAGLAKLFSLFLGAENRFKAVFSVTVFAVIATMIIQSVLTIVILSIKGADEVNFANLNSVIASNLGAVLEGILGKDALPKFVVGLASAVDIFAIWKIALLAIGYSAVSRKLKTATAATWLVVGYAVIAVIGAAVSAAFSPS